MYYCFVIEDLINIDDKDPLRLQANYAELLGQCLYCNLKEKNLYNKNKEKIELNGEMCFLRCTYDKYKEAAGIILNQSGQLKETLSDIEKIERWPSYIDTVRDIVFVDISDIYEEATILKLKQISQGRGKIFLKSVQKGFSVVVSLKNILEKNVEFYEFLKEQCDKCDCAQLLASAYYDIKKDAYGKKEARFFVMDGNILNCSRTLYSLKHSVSKKLKESAKSIVDKIGENKDFPRNYILDIVEFVEDHATFVDVVELNPLTTSMCYINNSVFDIVAEEIVFIYKKLGMGYEYCYDFLNNENRYVLKKYIGENYEYKSDEHYEFY